MRNQLGLTLNSSVRIAIVALTATVAFAHSAQAQDKEPAKAPPPLTTPAPVDAPEKLELETSAVDPRRQKFITIYIGIEHFEKVPYVPKGAKFKGDYKKIAEISIDRETNTLLFRALKEGVATLTIHSDQDDKLYEYRIDVKKSTLTKDAQEIRALLNDVEGITIKVVNNKVAVDGHVLTPRDMGRVITIVAQYGDRATNLVTLSPFAQRKIAQAIANAIYNPEITVTPVNEKFILEGMASDQLEKDRAFQIAQMYVPDLIKDFADLSGQKVTLRREFVLNLVQLKPPSPKEPGKIIQMVVHYVELAKAYTKSFRFQFTPTLEDKSTIGFTNDSRSPGGIISTITGTVSNLLPKLNWAKTYGHARVLQSSSLSVLDGQKGDLKNVTRIPYTTMNQQGQPITSFEDAGISTSITPQILNARSDSIRLALDFSMKTLLGSTDKGPMISNSALQTVIIVRSGQSAAVGGLITNQNSTDYNKLPKGNNVDPIVSLYASKSFQREQSQFVIFVTPIIKASASQGAEKVKQKFRIRD